MFSTRIAEGRRAAGVAAGLAACACMALAATASAGEDPLSGGTTKLKLSLPKGVNVQALGTAEKHGRTIKLPITDGSFDPVAGTGSETFAGAGLLFKFRGNVARVSQLAATYGKGGALSGKVSGSNKTVAKIKGGTDGRSGFGGTVGDATLKLTNAGAKALNRSLATNKRKPMRAGDIGTAGTKTEPSTVEVTGGTTSLRLDTAAATKLGGHGVRADHGGVRPLAPATADLATATLSFPNTGGSLAPDGLGGVVNAGGGVILQKTDPISAPCDAADKHPVGTAFTTSNLRADMAQKIILIDGQVGFGSPPVTGAITPVGSVIPNTPLGDLVVTGATSDPTALTITVMATSTQSTAGALGLGSIFGTSAEGCGIPATDFAAGDPLGLVTISATTH